MKEIAISDSWRSIYLFQLDNLAESPLIRFLLKRAICLYRTRTLGWDSRNESAHDCKVLIYLLWSRTQITRVNTYVWILRRDGGPPPGWRKDSGRRRNDAGVKRRGRWSRFDRINLAYSAAWRVLTIYSDIIKTINKMASHREHQGSISSSVPYHPSCPDRPLLLLACLRKLRSRTRLVAAVIAAAAAVWPPSKRVTRHEWMYITTWTF